MSDQFDVGNQPAHLRLFWQTDVDLAAADIRVAGRRFVPAPAPLTTDEPEIGALPEPASPLRRRILISLVLVTAICVAAVIRWPAMAMPALLLGLGLMGVLVVSALWQLSSTVAQQRENRALREALKRSQISRNEIRFADIRERTRPAA